MIGLPLDYGPYAIGMEPLDARTDSRTGILQKAAPVQAAQSVVSAQRF